MHSVFPTKILHIPNWIEGYIFQYHHPWNERILFKCIWNKKIEDTSIKEMIQSLQSLLVSTEENRENNTSDRLLYREELEQMQYYSIKGDILPIFFSQLRDLYKKFGYYQEEKMSFYLRKSDNIPCRVILPMEFLLYSCSSRTWASWSVRSAIRALNDGIIWWVQVKSKDLAEKQIAEYLGQSHSSPLRIAQAFVWGNICAFSQELATPSISWIGAPIE